MKKSLTVAVLVLVFTSVSLLAAVANDSLIYVDPPSADYFREPAGKGYLKICKKDDGPDVKKMPIPAGTYFADQGPVDGYVPSQPQLWLLTVVTAQSVTLKAGQKCAKIGARVVHSTPPPAHQELKSVERFKKSDNRYFEISASEDPDVPNPDLAPWNPTYPSLEATAASDFK